MRIRPIYFKNCLRARSRRRIIPCHQHYNNEVEDGRIVPDKFLQANADAGYQVAEVEIRDQRVIDLERSLARSGSTDSGVTVFSSRFFIAGVDFYQI